MPSHAQIHGEKPWFTFPGFLDARNGDRNVEREVQNALSSTYHFRTLDHVDANKYDEKLRSLANLCLLFETLLYHQAFTSLPEFWQIVCSRWGLTANYNVMRSISRVYYAARVKFVAEGRAQNSVPKTGLGGLSHKLACLVDEWRDDHEVVYVIPRIMAYEDPINPVVELREELEDTKDDWEAHVEGFMGRMIHYLDMAQWELDEGVSSSSDSGLSPNDFSPGSDTGDGDSDENFALQIFPSRLRHQSTTTPMEINAVEEQQTSSPHGNESASHLEASAGYIAADMPQNENEASPASSPAASSWPQASLTPPSVSPLTSPAQGTAGIVAASNMSTASSTCPPGELVSRPKADQCEAKQQAVTSGKMPEFSQTNACQRLFPSFSDNRVGRGRSSGENDVPMSGSQEHGNAGNSSTSNCDDVPEWNMMNGKRLIGPLDLAGMIRQYMAKEKEEREEAERRAMEKDLAGSS
ncbi:hypothetical protein JX266_009665 [Neoarthrinium moseri]|nr:hypothetical protein JX266_009665 [Neoarthrinium moseri]